MHYVDKGLYFESWIADLYKDSGKKKVKHNITKKINSHVRGQFDVVYGGLVKHYVECKYRSKNSAVSFSDVATFSAKLELFNISYKRGIIVTNSYLEPRAKHYAKSIRLEVVEGEDVKKMHVKRTKLFQRKKEKKKSLETIIFT